MDRERTERAFAAEAAAPAAAAAALTGPEWELPTRCAPWNVRELLAHVTVAIGRVPGMLAGPAPARAEVTAAGYYRPDARFSPETNAARVALARDRSAARPAADFDATRRAVQRACAGQPADRVVRTRHGDAMRLADFMATRVVELALHGLDLADALAREAWLTAEAADLVTDLLLGPDHEAARRRLGWSRLDLLRRTTGRAPLTSADRARVDALGITWLALG